MTEYHPLASGEDVWWWSGRTKDNERRHGAMTFTVKIDTDNEAFGEDPGYELARLLRKTAERLETAGIEAGEEETLRDANGNTVGWYALAEG